MDQNNFWILPRNRIYVSIRAASIKLGVEGVDQPGAHGVSCRACRGGGRTPVPPEVDHLGVDLLKLPVKGEEERDLAPPAEMLRVTTLPKEHAEIGSFILQGVEEVH
jgi:hypothetical protein